MSESILVRTSKVPDILTMREVAALFNSILTDLAAIKTSINTHTHGGVTVGAGSTGVANVAPMGTLNTVA